MSVASEIVARLRAAGCVFAEDEARVLTEAAETPEQLETMVATRATGVPLEHVVGWAEFCGLRIAVDPGVFVPRPRSALLAREAAAVVGRLGGTATVLDVCCGSGALGATLLSAYPRIELHAVDIDAASVRCARSNIGTGVAYEGNLYEPLPECLRGTLDLIVANAPYVPSGAIAMLPPEAREYEPIVALDGGEDGLDVQRAIVAQAPHWLRSGGRLLIESSERQAPLTCDAFIRTGLSTRVVRDEELGATVVVGTRP